MPNNCKLDEQAIIKLIKKVIKPIKKKQKKTRLSTLNLKDQTSLLKMRTATLKYS